MGANTKIEWCQHTWSPWIGCQKTGSMACEHCYAESLNKRAGGGNWGPHAPRRRTSVEYWKQPARWNAKAARAGKKAFVFPSMCDPWDNQADPAWRHAMFDAFAPLENLVLLLLTKRIQNAVKMVEAYGKPLPRNVALGCTVVTQDEVDRDIPQLCRAAMTFLPAFSFLSIEPMMGPIDLRKYLATGYVDWVICGGESGGGARPMHPEWARTLRDDCAEAGVPFLFKQWGEHLPVGQHLPGCGKVHGATAVRPGRMKLHYGGTPTQHPKHAFAERGVEFTSTADGRLTFRVGKNRAGNLLDGHQHLERPMV